MVSELDKAGNLDCGAKLLSARDYAAAMDLPMYFVPGGSDDVRIESANNRLLVPTNFIEKGKAASLQSVETAGNDQIPLTKAAGERLARWSQDAADARAKRITPSELHNRNLDQLYADRLNQRLHDAAFQQEFFKHNQDMVRAAVQKRNPAVHMEDNAIAAQLPSLFGYWHGISFSDQEAEQARAQAFANMSKVVDLLSAAPK